MGVKRSFIEVVHGPKLSRATIQTVEDFGNVLKRFREMRLMV